MTDSVDERPALVIDAANLLIRSYMACGDMSSHGYQMGGAMGFLRKVRWLVEDLSPRIVYVAWESGGSPRRRALYSEYKRGRRPGRLNRFYEDDIPESDENRVHQTKALLEFLRHSPVCQLYVKDCEADDVVAWLCKSKLKDRPKIIVSSDKDMFQLLDPTTSQYSLHEKKVVTMHDVHDRYYIMPWNFALAKALVGDPSDNIPGIKGMGFKTAVKKIPLLASHNGVLLQEVIDYCHANANESEILARVVAKEKQLRTNWRLVNLGSASLSPSQVRVIERQVDTFVPRADKMGLLRSLVREGIREFDVDGYIMSFACIEGLGFSVGK